MTETSYTATMATLARIYDVGRQYLRYGGVTFEPDDYGKYIRDLYAGRSAGWMPFLNYGLLASMIAFVIVVVMAFVNGLT